MARRYRQGLARYSPKRAQAARTRARTGPRPDSKAGRRAARAAAARGRLPKPGTAAARRRYQAFIPDNEETRWLKRAALQVTLDKRHDPRDPNPYQDDLTAIGERRYREAYNAQQREKRAAKPKATAKPKGQRKLSWTWVKRHKRRLPG